MIKDAKKQRKPVDFFCQPELRIEIHHLYRGRRVQGRAELGEASQGIVIGVETVDGAHVATQRLEKE